MSGNLFAVKEININYLIGKQYYNLTIDQNYALILKEEATLEFHDFLISISPSDGIVLDVGANIGVTALLFANNAKQVLAFEPAKWSFMNLKKNIAHNLVLNVEAMNFALGKKNSTLTLTTPVMSPASAFLGGLQYVGAEYEIQEVLCVNGDKYIKSKNPSGIKLIKIDVEGYELEVLKGLQKTIVKHKPNVVLECNHWCLNAFQRVSIPEFYDYLLSIFPNVQAIEGQRRLNLRDPRERYTAMYEHITSFKFMNIYCYW